MPTADSDSEKAGLEAVLSSIYESKSPALLIDGLVARHGATATAKKLAETLKFPTFCPPMGKSIIDERKDYFYGEYGGMISYPGIQDAVENQSDLVLYLGPNLSDSNTGGFSAKLATEKTIYVHADSVVVKGKEFPDVRLAPCTSRGFPPP
jgi:pyruvate decarboxylase